MKHPIIIFLCISFVLLSCKSRYLVKTEKITFEKLNVSQNSQKDSILLSFELTLPPKTVGKKNISVIFPMVIQNRDTIKFNTLTFAGAGNENDCMNIPYKLKYSRHYKSFKDAFPINAKDDTILVFLITQYIKKDEFITEIMFQKKLGKLLSY